MTYFDGLFFYSPARAQPDIESGEAAELYSLHFCRTGQVWWRRGDEEPRLLPAPVAWWTVPGQRTTFGPAGERSLPAGGWEHFEVTFGGPRAAIMQDGGLIEGDEFKPHFVLLHDSGAFERAFLSLVALAEDDTNGAPQRDASAKNAPARAVLLLEEVLLSLSEHSPPAFSLSPLEQAVSDWLERVRSAPHQQWSIAEGARTLSISQGHFRRLARKLVGVSPYRFALERRLDAAAQRLRGSKEPIKSLAPACGFKDVNHFSRLFAERYHLPPAAYRRANRVATLESARIRRRQSLFQSLKE